MMWRWMLDSLHALKPKEDIGLIESFDLEIQADGVLVVRPVVGILRIEDLQKLAWRIQEADPKSLAGIHFDFSAVPELEGPWSAHFAMLIRLGKMIKVPVSLAGLTGQPAAVARLFSSCPEMRRLLKQRAHHNLHRAHAVSVSEVA